EGIGAPGAERLRRSEKFVGRGGAGLECEVHFRLVVADGDFVDGDHRGGVGCGRDLLDWSPLQGEVCKNNAAGLQLVIAGLQWVELEIGAGDSIGYGREQLLGIDDGDVIKMPAGETVGADVVRTETDIVVKAKKQAGAGVVREGKGFSGESRFAGSISSAL